MLIYALIDPRDCSPIRVRLSRAKGFRLPENTVVVARPGKWGNVFSVAPFQRAGSKVGGGQYVAVPTLADAIECYTIWLNESVAGKEIAAQAKAELRGKNLACWCKLDQYCHADILLKVANR